MVLGRRVAAYPLGRTRGVSFHAGKDVTDRRHDALCFAQQVAACSDIARSGRHILHLTECQFTSPEPGGLCPPASPSHANKGAAPHPCVPPIHTWTTRGFLTTLGRSHGVLWWIGRRVTAAAESGGNRSWWTDVREETDPQGIRLAEKSEGEGVNQDGESNGHSGSRYRRGDPTEDPRRGSLPERWWRCCRTNFRHD